MSTPLKETLFKNVNLKDVSLIGEPIKILSLDENSRKFILDDQAIESVLINNQALDKPVCIIGISGDYRKGKSFILNFLIRYLSYQNKLNLLNKYNYTQINDWLPESDLPLKGFTWRSGCEQETTGIWMWTYLFKRKIKKKKNFNINSNKYGEDLFKNEFHSNTSTEDSYEDVAVIVLDSQGAFDVEFSFTEYANLFVITCLISSMHIFNVLHQLQENDLQLLQLLSEYGNLIAKQNFKSKPFQRLTFLIRDWCYPQDYAFGEKGGLKYILNKFLINKSLDNLKLKKKHHLIKKPKENILSRKDIQKYFQKIDCFILPYPGDNVATNSKYNGNTKDMKKQFYIYLKHFVEWFINDLKIKCKNENETLNLTGLEWLNLIKILIKKINECEGIIKPITIFESMARLSHNYVLELCIKEYNSKMENNFGFSKPFVWYNLINQSHLYLMKKIVKKFTNHKKIGSHEFENEYIEKLSTACGKLRDSYILLNRSKCLEMPTFMITLILILITYLIYILISVVSQTAMITSILKLIIVIQFLIFIWMISVNCGKIEWGKPIVDFIEQHLQLFYQFFRARNLSLNLD